MGAIRYLINESGECRTIIQGPPHCVVPAQAAYWVFLLERRSEAAL